MELYTTVSEKLAQQLTEQYSTSFSSASKLFDPVIRKHVYNIYGFVRIADEIVDTYDGSDKASLLTEIENETHLAITRGFSSNPILHAFALTANKFGIDTSLIQPFIESMRMDITKTRYNRLSYEKYIYGSAEVVGLMCLRVFCNGDATLYTQLEPGAKKLGAAYQKVNFLRDIADDYGRLGRWYFPGLRYETFNEQAKQAIIDEITADFDYAQTYLEQLPDNARSAVRASYRYYTALLNKLAATPSKTIKHQRIRISNAKKALLLAGTVLRRSA